jgi:hypothetical protein
LVGELGFNKNSSMCGFLLVGNRVGGARDAEEESGSGGKDGGEAGGGRVRV